MKNAKLFILFVFTVVSLLQVTATHAAVHVISMYFYGPNGTYYYDTNNLSVPQGDIVTWSNADFVFPYPYYHSTTSGSAGTPNGLWDSGTVSNGVTFTLNTATISPGTYPYFCTIDYAFYGMSGTLTVSAVVKPPPPLLTSAAMLPGGTFKMNLSGTSGQTYTIEGSSNLLDWSPLFTNSAGGNAFSATDLTSTNVLRRYYRAR
jgi:plastocyanin